MLAGFSTILISPSRSFSCSRERTLLNIRWRVTVAYATFGTAIETADSYDGRMGAAHQKARRRIPKCSGVIRVYDEAGNVIETHNHIGEFKEP